MPRQCTWTPEQDRFLKANYGKLQFKEIAEILGKPVSSISMRVTRLNIPRTIKEPTWTQNDIQFLRQNWGKFSIRSLASRLHRTGNSIMVKSKRLKLGPIQDKSLFSKREIAELLHVDHRKVDQWLKQGLKSKLAPTSREYGKSRNILQVKPQDLVDFLRDHPDQWDARKAGDIRRSVNQKELLKARVEIQRTEGVTEKRVPDHLRSSFARFVIEVAGQSSIQIRDARKSMDWLKEKKRRDIETRLPREGFRWTPEEDEHLRKLFRKGDRTDREIGLVLGRSEAAIEHRLMRIRETIWSVAI